MITFDGDRSLRRKWFARKQLSVIKDLDVPGKAVKWDGFTFRVWQQDDLDGGRVTAPMGAIVACSSPAGVRVSVSDYWAGGVTSLADLNVLYTFGNDLTVTSYNLVDEETMLASGVQTIKCRPEITASYFGLEDGTTITEETVFIQDQSPMLGIMPYQGAEAFWLTSTSKAFIDLNGNEIPDLPKAIIDSSLTFYNSNGSNLGGRRTITFQGGGADALQQRIVQQLDSTKQIVHNAATYEWASGDLVRGWFVDFPDFNHIPMSTVLAGSSMPDELEDIILYDDDWQNIWPVGSYAFQSNGVQTFLQASDGTNTIKWDGSTTAEAYFIANPGQEHWKLFLTLTIGGSSYLISSSQFLSLLDSLATVPIIGASTNWTNALRMLYQLFPYPNNNFNVPYDSAMFHAHDDDIYTWTRAYGSVKFDSTGIHSTSLVVPTEVSTENGVRPDVTLAGVYDEEPLYLCICNKVGEEIKAVYYGSPFDSWTALPASETTLVHVRPVKVTPSEIFLIGVMQSTELVDEVETEVYSFAWLRWSLENSGVWQKLGRLPFSVGDFDTLQVGLFGDDVLVNELTNYLSPPPALPQMPVGPYAKYSIGLP